MRLGTLAAVGLVVVLAARTAGAESPSEVSVVVGGTARNVPGWSLAGAQAPADAGDVLLVDWMWPVTRSSSEPPRFRSSSSALYEETGADEAPRLIGVRLPGPRRGSALVPPLRAPEGGTNPGKGKSGAESEDAGIPQLTDEEMGHVRSVVVERWSAGAARFLARVNPATTCVEISGVLEQALPELPENLRYLLVTRPIPVELSGLARLRELRFLVLRGEVPSPVDPRALAELKDLRVLELPFGGVDPADPLSGLTHLRDLRPMESRSLTDLAWLRGCTSLRRLDVSHTGVTDLSPLGDLPALEAVDAHLSPVRTLPAGPCASLRSLRLGSTAIPPETLATFRRDHPDCEIVPGRKDALLAAIEGVERVRIRTGGNCHRDPENEVVRTELRTPEAIREFLGLLEIDDCGGIGGCMCCGTPTFEFHAGSKLLAAVSLHHNSHLRWVSGAWPGDVFLADTAVLPLAQWLERHGEPEPMEGLEYSRRRAAAERRREERQLALLGTELLATLRAGLEEAETIRQYPEVLRRFEPDTERRVLLALRLLSAAGETWSEDVTYAASYLLQAESPDSVLKVGRSANTDDEAQDGFARYVLGIGVRGNLPDAVLDELVRPAALRLLASADPGTRGHAIDRLGQVRRPVAIDLLRRVLAGQRVGPDGAWGPGGASERRTAEGESGDTEASTNIAIAASSLIEVGDVESLPRIREVVSGLHGEERRRMLERIETLGGAGKATEPE